MRRTWVLLAVVAVLAAVLVGSATAKAQNTEPITPQPITPRQCGAVTPYDLNHDGTVNGRDFDLWVRTVHEGLETCQINGPASGCPSWVDVNGDGIVSVLDLDAMHQFEMWCVRPPMNAWPGH
jgi:hypothetical protein